MIYCGDVSKRQIEGENDAMKERAPSTSALDKTDALSDVAGNRDLFMFMLLAYGGFLMFCFPQLSCIRLCLCKCIYIYTHNVLAHLSYHLDNLAFT